MNEERIQRIEDILIELALYKGKCSYIYLSDLQEILNKHGLIKEIPSDKIYKVNYIRGKRR